MNDVENGMLDYAEPDYSPTVCPICGEVCETIYKDKWGNILGCEECVEAYDASEVLNDE